VLGMAATAHRIWQGEGFGFRVSGSRVRGIVRGALVVGMLALIAYRFALSYPRADGSNRPEDDGLEPGRAILADAPAPQAAVLGAYGESVSLRYLTDIWGLRADVTAVSSAEARRLLAEGIRPVYVTVSAAPLVWSEVSSEARFSSAGLTLIALRLQPQTEVPAMQHTLLRDLGDNLRFLGYDLQPQRPSLTLYWQATGPIVHDWSVSVRPTRGGELLFDDQGLIQFDHQHPVHGLYPSSSWVSGEVVRDDYALSLPSGFQADGITVVVYRPVAGGFQDLAQVKLAWPP